MSSRKIARLALLVAVATASFSVSHSVARDVSEKVRLESGIVSKFRWWVNAYRGRTSLDPCLQLEIVPMGRRSPLEVGLGETSCRPVSPLPNAFGVVDELDHPKVTFIVMAFPRNARTISLYFQGQHHDRTLPLEPLSSLKMRKAELRSFRYVSFAFQGNSCLSRFITHDSKGRVLDDGGHMRCRA
jgi:hypothetical protein